MNFKQIKITLNCDVELHFAPIKFFVRLVGLHVKSEDLVEIKFGIIVEVQRDEIL